MAKDAQNKRKASAPGMRQSSSGRMLSGVPAPAARQRPPLLWLSLAALAIIAVAWFASSALHRTNATAKAPSTPPPYAGVFYPSQGHQGHLPGDMKRYAHFHYSSDPPTSGFHQELFTKQFVSTTPIPRYVQVHLLEHGNVLLQYNCLCPDTVNSLTRIAQEFDSRLLPTGTIVPSTTDVRNGEEQGLAVIVAPYPGMSSPIALTAWTRLGTMTTVDEGKVISFINLYLHNVDNLNS